MSKKTKQTECLYEYIFFIKKDLPQKLTIDFKGTTNGINAIVSDTKNI